MIEYKIHVMLRDDILRDPDSNTLGIPIDGETKILKFKDGVADTKDKTIADFIRNCFGARFIVKEIEHKEIIKPKQKELKTVDENIQDSFTELMDLMGIPKDIGDDEIRVTPKPAVMKSASDLKTTKSKKYKKTTKKKK